MPAISSLGIGSGLDIKTLITQLINAEKEGPALRLDQREANAQGKISALGFLKSSLTEFQDKNKELSLQTTFEARKATSSDHDFFTVSADPSAAIGSYKVQVNQLAKEHRIQSVNFEGADDVIGTGTLTIASGSNLFVVDIDSSNNTLSGIRNAINNADGNSNVTANIIHVDDGLGGTASRLVLSSKSTGTSQKVSVMVNDTTEGDVSHIDMNGLSRLAYEVGVAENLIEVQAAEDAEILLDGAVVTRSSNVISDAIDSVSIHLLKADNTKEHTLSIGVDRDKVTKQITDFVSKFNGLATTLNALTDVKGQQDGLLTYDATARDIESQIRSIINSQVEGANTQFKSLSSMGIYTEKDGTLLIKTADLNKALDEDFDGLGQLFASTNGYAKQLNTLITDYVSSGGVIGSKEEGLKSKIQLIEKDRKVLTERLNSMEKRYIQQFTALDSLLSQLSASSNFLAQQMDMISSMFKRK